MNVDVTDNPRNRLNKTECIKCMECVMNWAKEDIYAGNENNSNITRVYNFQRTREI